MENKTFINIDNTSEDRASAIAAVLEAVEASLKDATTVEIAIWHTTRGAVSHCELDVQDEPVIVVETVRMETETRLSPVSEFQDEDDNDFNHIIYW